MEWNRKDLRLKLIDLNSNIFIHMMKSQWPDSSQISRSSSLFFSAAAGASANSISSMPHGGVGFPENSPKDIQLWPL